VCGFVAVGAACRVVGVCVWVNVDRVGLIPHPVATLGFPTVVYGAGSALKGLLSPSRVRASLVFLPNHSVVLRVWA